MLEDLNSTDNTFFVIYLDDEALDWSISVHTRPGGLGGYEIERRDAATGQYDTTTEADHVTIRHRGPDLDQEPLTRSETVPSPATARLGDQSPPSLYKRRCRSAGAMPPVHVVRFRRLTCNVGARRSAARSRRPMRSTRLRAAIVTVLLGVVAVTGYATSAQAVDWGPQTLYWNDLSRGTHYGKSYEYNGLLYDEITVKDTRADGNPMYSNFKWRHYYYSTSFGTSAWSNWDGPRRVEVENGTIFKKYYDGKMASGSKWQTEHVLYINLNNMPDKHATALYTTVAY